MAYTLGIDIGSGYSKAVVCEGSLLRSSVVIPSGGNYSRAAMDVADAAVREAGIVRGDITATVATGYGASMVDFADQTITDISSHAFAVHYLFPSARTVVEVGAQFSKAIRIDESGRPVNFILNEKCAGGSGKFLQVIARILRMDVSGIGELSLKAQRPVEFTTGCAVFAESEAVSRIAEGALPEDILAGVHKAMASKIVNLVTRLILVEDCAVTGGGAMDIGLVKTIETELGIKVFVPPDPRITAAFGAALLASQGANPTTL
jgi:(R)-2-hydroxyacyl-CoA dehydratese activating ATPase